MSLITTFLWSLLLVVGGFVIGYLVVLGLAKVNILFTRVEQGWCKIILRWGKYVRTIGPGLRWIGIPGMHALYRRKMTFMKSVTDSKGVAQAELHPLENEKDGGIVSSFKTTRYPYALPFKDEEDSHALPLSGLIAVFGVIEDYGKAFFNASDWYAEMNTKILSCFRDLLAEISYDDDIVGRDTEEERVPDSISARLWEALNSQQNGVSILDELHAAAGIRVESVVLRSIDPPVGWRDTTLAPYKAQRDAAAAVHRAMASALEFDDTNQALKKWLASHKTATKAQIEAKQRELRERALAKTPGYQQIDIRGLENATTAVVGGGGAGVMVGGGGQGNRGKDSDGSGKKKGLKSKDQLAGEFFERNGIYPKWDPQRRTPN